ncbi:hypothetical protein GCM10009839_10650 [Catenulispora yoronensis]|uniref:Leucine rich repeat variant n=1 Tax=Catenulispora yoronensis TaxID=450799 RepID=A0ABN2TQT6_9ACTN
MNMNVGAGSGLVGAWARGLAGNPAAPVDLLMRLVEPVGLPEWAMSAWAVLCAERVVPEAVVDAVVAHRRSEPKRMLARNPYATPRQRGRLVGDPDAMVRLKVACGPGRRDWLIRPLPDDVLIELLTAQDGVHPPGLVTATEIKQELVSSGQVPARFYAASPSHPKAEMRQSAASDWLHLSDAERAALLADPDPDVRAAAEDARWVLDPLQVQERMPRQRCHARTSMLLSYPMSRAVAEEAFDDEDGYAVAKNPYAPADLVARLAGVAPPRIRCVIAARFDLDPEVRRALCRDPDEQVRLYAQAYGAVVTRGQHVALEIANTEPIVDFWPRKIDEFLDLGEPRWYVRAADSDNVLLRRAAAMDARLPETQMRALAADPDTRVRALLTENHPGTPAHTMIERFVAEPQWRPLLLTLPHMPRTGLAALLDHPDAQVRALAAADAALPEPPATLLHDPDPAVRKAAAANPLLPAHLVDQALNDAADPARAEGAASNAVLSAAVLWGLLEAVEAAGAAGPAGVAGPAGSAGAPNA